MPVWLDQDIRQTNFEIGFDRDGDLPLLTGRPPAVTRYQALPIWM
jgi:hypothetical protein